jgi:hypothetical protein
MMNRTHLCSKLEKFPRVVDSKIRGNLKGRFFAASCYDMFIGGFYRFLDHHIDSSLQSMIFWMLYALCSLIAKVLQPMLKPPFHPTSFHFGRVSFFSQNL